MPSTIAAVTSTIIPENIPTQEFENTSTSFVVSDEERERKVFVGELNKFMAEIGKPLSKIPIMGYKELDLYQLFREVSAYGGFNEVVKNVGTWSKIWKRLGNFDPSITDSSFRLKKNYERYLLEYEYKLFPEHRQQANDKQSKKMHTEGAGSVSPTLDRQANMTRNSAKKSKRRAFGASFIKEIPREPQGTPKLPLNLGEITLENLGTVIPKLPYITEKHIWPIGYECTRYFSSMQNPELQVKYTCKIVDGGDKPQFVISAEDDEANPIISQSPSGAWRIVLKRTLGSEKAAPVSGNARFGLTHPTIRALIRELPLADKCSEIFAVSVSPSTTRRGGKRRQNESSSDDANSSDEEFVPSNAKRTRNVISPSSSLSSLPQYTMPVDDLEDLEVAIATLHALKYCSVY